jgi:hypothetical protein
MHSAVLPILLAVAGSMNADRWLFERTRPLVHQLNWKWRNQRQIRKDRRRAFANGNRKAFR